MSDPAVASAAPLSSQPAPVALDILILARDEADVLPGTLASLSPQLEPHDHVTVVADHCRDGTASVAIESGARVLMRKEGTAGKGQALRWWLQQTQPRSSPEDRVVILDADSRVRAGFLDVMRREIGEDSPVVQAVLEQSEREVGSSGRLASLSEVMDQRVYDGFRSRMGWPVRLRGTGMGFLRSALEGSAEHLETSVEDAELSILLGAIGIPIRMAWQARVLDAKPDNDDAAIRQRARWVKGQLDLVRRHPRPLLALLGQGPRGWSLLTSVFGKPRSFTVLLRVGGWLLLALAPGLGYVGSALQVLLALSLGFDAAALAASVVLSQDPTAALLSLLRLPAFLLVWLRSLMLAARSRDRWLRARPRPHDAGVTSPGPASP